MIKWYADNEMAIMFDNTPEPDMRFPLPDMSEEEEKEVENKPFINKKDLLVVLFNHKKLKKYKFEIKKDYTWDGATVPKAFWRLIGAKTDPQFLIPSLIHDKLCENHNLVNNDRYFASKVFERLLYVAKVPAFKRWIMFHCVEEYQKLCGKWEEEK